MVPNLTDNSILNKNFIRLLLEESSNLLFLNQIKDLKTGIKQILNMMYNLSKKIIIWWQFQIWTTLHCANWDNNTSPNKDAILKKTDLAWKLGTNRTANYSLENGLECIFVKMPNKDSLNYSTIDTYLLP